MSANSNTFVLDVNGYHSWELLFDIDNSENSGTIRRKFEVKTSVSCSFHRMRQHVLNCRAATSAGLNCSGKLVKIVDISVKGDMNQEVKYNYESMSETKLEYKTETKKTDEYEIGPHSRLKMYRLVFNGPGINYITDTISSTPHEMQAVLIRFTAREVLFLKGTDVVYTHDSVSRPANVVNEANGKSPDINADNEGLPVWLVPRWTNTLAEAASGIQLVIQNIANPNYTSLCRGPIPRHRYIKMELDPHSKTKITKIALYRAEDRNDDPCKDGKWQYKTDNISSNNLPELQRTANVITGLLRNPILIPILLPAVVPLLLLSKESDSPRNNFLYLVWNVTSV